MTGILVYLQTDRGTNEQEHMFIVECRCTHM